MNIIEAINDPGLFKPLFKDLATWRAWIVFLKALFALAMDQEEQAIYRTCTGRQDPPDKPFGEAWAPTGRRSGKSFVAALVGVFLACFKNYLPYLSHGERAHILIIAADRAQAGVILRYVKGFMASNPMLSKLVESEKAESVDLTNRVTIQVMTCSFRSIRGLTVVAAICDEIAFWRSEENSANPANEVLRAIRPSLATIPDSLLLCISSPWARTGPLWQAMNKHHGRDDSETMVWSAPTLTMNPCIKQKVIDRDLEEDPEMARCEWGAEFRSDLESYLPLEALEAVIVQGRFELPPRLAAGLLYQAFVDPSGGRRDAAALAITHREQERIILDVARAWKAPHDPAVVVGEMAGVLRTFGLSRITGDRYAGAWPEQEFLKHGISYQAAEKDKSSLYIDFLPLVLSQRVELLDLKHLKNELVSLERRARSAGRDLVDHPPRGHDDLANAVAGACTLAARRKREARILTRPLDWRQRQRPEPEPAPLHPRLQYPAPKIPNGKGE